MIYCVDDMIAYFARTRCKGWTMYQTAWCMEYTACWETLLVGHFNISFHVFLIINYYIN